MSRLRISIRIQIQIGDHIPGEKKTQENKTIGCIYMVSIQKVYRSNKKLELEITKLLLFYL